MNQIPAYPLIDWFSFTLPNDTPHDELGDTIKGLSETYTIGWYTSWGSFLPHPTDWVKVKPNPPFRCALQMPETGARMEWGGGSDRLLVMLPGKACDHIRKLGKLDDLMTFYAPYATRVDFAVDMLCDTKPSAFVNARIHKRHKNLSFHTSEDGDTCYVGSWSSDRFCRVYRYNAPHERAHLLRAEHIFRGKEAQAFIRGYLRRGSTSAMEFCQTVYGWSAAHWTNAPLDNGDMEDFKWHRPERHASKTLKWLEETCIPSIVRLASEGEIENPYEWFREQLLKQLSGTRDKIDTSSQSEEA